MRYQLHRRMAVRLLKMQGKRRLPIIKLFICPVFSCDSGLYFDNVPDEIQPGVHVRTINGKYLSDEEMLAYYTGLGKEVWTTYGTV